MSLRSQLMAIQMDSGKTWLGNLLDSDFNF